MTLKEVCDQVISCDKGLASWRNSEGQSGALTTAMFWQKVARTPLFVLDEVGLRDRVSDFVYEQLFQMLEVRYGVPTVIISNLTIDQIRSVFDDRIVSRLGRGTVMPVRGSDLRLEGKR